ncbi:hypothetical protein LSI54_00820 [Nesterenkonia sp. AY15]|uniref:hypothetical protein n=1 Tax=Nesterenkonia sp. AY15 TaxID=2901139 RepID=UPI001F4D0F9A|nr:hypothetical protein [Nesterenkonia sp. AY15]MCH8569910.1 hypothetical protein [Nesterenkonia sp. AY15]
MDSRLNMGAADHRRGEQDWMKRGARRAVPLSGAALVSIALLVGAAPTAAVASPDAPSTSAAPTTGTGDTVDQQVDGDASESNDDVADPGPAPSPEPAPEPLDPSEDPGEDPLESPEDPTLPADPMDTPEPEPVDPGPTDPAPTDPEPTDPEPTAPGPTDPGPTEPESTDPELPQPEPTDEESPPVFPTDPEEEISAPAEGEHYLRCGSAFTAPGQTETLRLQMSSGLTDLTVGSSLTGATIWIDGGVVYYQAPSPLPPGSAQDDFAVRGISPSGERVADRCNIGLQSTSEGADDAVQPTPPQEPDAGEDIPAPVTPETPEAAETPSAASTPAEASETFSGPPIPGMPGYSLPGRDASGTSPSASAAQPTEASEQAAPSELAEDSELAATGLNTLQAFNAVVLALVAILAGAAAMVVAARRSDSPG